MNDLLSYAITFLAQTRCSEKEFINHLKEKFLTSLKTDNLNTLIAYLKDNCFLNDHRLAENLASRYSHKGDRFILHLLKRRKIDKQIIKLTLARLPSEKKRAFREALDKVKKIKEHKEAFLLLQRYLSGRLFSTQVINSILRQLCALKIIKINAS